MKKMTKLALLLAASVFATSSLVSCYSGSDDNESWVDGGHSNPVEITLDMLKVLDKTGNIVNTNVDTVTSVSAAGDSNITASVSGKKVTFTNAIAKKDYKAGKNDSGNVSLTVDLAGSGEKSGYTQKLLVQAVVVVDELGYIKSVNSVLLPVAPSSGKFTVKASDFATESTETSTDKGGTGFDGIHVAKNGFYFYCLGSNAGAKSCTATPADTDAGTVAYIGTRGGLKTTQNYLKFPVSGACSITVKYVSTGSADVAPTILLCNDDTKISATSELTKAASKKYTEAAVQTGTFNITADTLNADGITDKNIYLGGASAIGIVEFTIDYGN